MSLLVLLLLSWDGTIIRLTMCRGPPGEPFRNSQVQIETENGPLQLATEDLTADTVSEQNFDL